MRLRLAACAAALALAACNGLTSTLAIPAPATVAEAGGVAVAAPTVAPANLETELARLQRELERRIVRRDWGVPLQLSRGAGPWLRLRLAADPSFEPGGAQLRAAALLLYAEIGAVLRGAPVVAHVLGHGDTESADLSTDLSARRAASVHSYLLAQQMPAARLRAEGRGAREPATAEAGAGAANRRIEIVIRPVVVGREAEAWLPPDCEGCARRG